MYRFSPLGEVAADGIYKRVGVPSRLYTPRSPERPLAGKRVTLKDNIHLSGIQTTMMNKAYTTLYPPEKDNAAFVQTLLRQGAVILGKTKMNSFASGENPDQWVDFHCPFNPRMDLYQSPSGSTTGGGASTAGYDWLDLAIGTDSKRIMHPLLTIAYCYSHRKHSLTRRW
jgi:Asp-tRNA(Asn)/Glu-tRNA(Gln) amidotransferase A subunit family amidase